MQVTVRELEAIDLLKITLFLYSVAQEMLNSKQVKIRNFVKSDIVFIIIHAKTPLRELSFLDRQILHRQYS